MKKKIKNNLYNNKLNQQQRKVEQEDLEINRFKFKDKMKNKDNYIKKN